MAKYDQNGCMVKVVEELKNGQYLVRKFFAGRADDWEDEELYAGNELFIVSDVFDAPPTEKLDQRIRDLQEIADAWWQTRQKLEHDLRVAEKEGKARLAKYKKYDQLKTLDMFLDGKITHYVIEKAWSGIEIVPFADTKCDSQYDQQDRHKLLTLFGRTNGVLEWRLSEYSDGSGTKYAVIPCTSYDEALNIAQDYVNNKMGDVPNSRIVNMAKKYGLKINPEYIRKYEEKEKAKKDRDIEELEKKLRKLRENDQA